MRSRAAQIAAAASQRKRLVLVAAGAVVVALAGVIAVLVAGDDTGPRLADEADPTVEEDVQAAPESPDDAPDDAMPSDAPDGAPGDSDRGAARTGEWSSAGPLDGAREIIRDAEVTVAYDDDFDAARDAIARAADRVGGQVTDADLRSHADDDDRDPRGTLTLLVPSDELDATLDALADAGEVRDQTIRSEDVTGEIVDLEARLSHLERTEQFYLDLFDEADGVDDALALQDRLDSVQQRIEEVRTRLDRLDEDVATSTVTVDLVAADAVDEPRLPLADHLDDAAEAFASVTGTIIVFAGGLAPILIVAGILVALWRGVAQQRRRPSTT